MRRWLASGAVLLCALGTAACGGDDASAGTDETETIDIAFSGETVTPSGERVEIAAGQPVDLVVEADAPGEIHLHSDPEQKFEYAKGTTTIPITIDRPGVVPVESHELDQVIVQLEVR